MQSCFVNGVATLACLPTLFGLIINAAFVFLGSVAVIFIILAGIKLITSGGDPKQAQSAQQTLTYAIIGLVVVLLSFAIINTIADITGVQCIKTFGFGCGGG